MEELMSDCKTEEAGVGPKTEGAELPVCKNRLLVLGRSDMISRKCLFGLNDYYRFMFVRCSKARKGKKKVAVAAGRNE